jgi:CRISPR-associated protein Cmr6
MTKLNLHKLFYTNYFKTPVKEDGKFVFDGIERINNEIIGSNFESNHLNAQLLLIGNESFTLTTKYPGLLVGAGYDHETHSDKEFKLGFSFDFTTGLPIIPGASVKGILRSAFRKKVNNQEYGLVLALLQEIKKEIAFEQCVKLETELFGDTEENSISMSSRDIFHDAIIDPCHTGLFMANDFITPHRNRNNPEMSIYTNPIPLQLLKIKSNVPIRFQFEMKQRDNEILTMEERRKFYEATLRLLGVGAKTRVGYGKFKQGNPPCN